MKRLPRILLTVAALLAAVSCKLDEEAYNPIHYGTRGFASSLCKYILESSVNAMEQKADNEEVFKDGFILVYNENYYSKIEVRKLEGADSTWVVTNAVTEADKDGYYAYEFDPRNLQYTLILRLLGRKEGDEFNTWNASFTGEYDEKDGYTATMQTRGNGMRMFWEKTTSHSSVMYSLTGSGSCQVEIFRNGDPVDKVIFEY